uniref:Uncharacterized protein n=1 Tax=Mesocestoides corti TaxID=53468 RepID=A0A5K3FKM2_MESCO
MFMHRSVTNTRMLLAKRCTSRDSKPPPIFGRVLCNYRGKTSIKPGQTWSVSLS